MTDPTSTTTASSDPSRSFFGHPLGLRTLFLTEMFERITYYGMRAILLLYLVAAIKDGGLGIDEKTGSAIYGLYISGTYLLSLIGGYIADRIIGAQRAVWWGGIFIMIGNACLVIRADAAVLLRAHDHRGRRGAAEAQHQRHRRAALPGRRLAA